MEEEKTKRKILEKASELFLYHGYSKINMEEICRSLSISRKTMYKYFSNKEDLLKQVLTQRYKSKSEAINCILTNSDWDFMQKFKNMIQYISREIPKETVYFMQDIKTNAPGIWNEYIEMRNKDIPSRMQRFLDEGMKKGIIKKSVNPKIFIRIHLAIVQSIMNPDTMMELNTSPAEIIEQIDSILFFGIMDQTKFSKEKTVQKPKKINLKK